MGSHIEQPLLFRILYKFARRKKLQGRGKKKQSFVLEKRQKFAIGVILLSLGLFLPEYLLNGYGLIVAFLIALLSDVFLWWAIAADLKVQRTPQVFILPFLYSLSFGVFSFLTPARLITRILLTTLYAVGMYAVFLSENIFVVASIRTIALLSSARIVSLVTSLVTYFFLINTIFSFRITIFPTIALLLICSFIIVLHAIWAYTLEQTLQEDMPWVLILTLCLIEVGVVLWFWPTSPTVVALFLTSILYIFTGLSHVWMDKRLFRNVLWEYAWVGSVALVLLLVFTQWQG